MNEYILFNYVWYHWNKYFVYSYDIMNIVKWRSGWNRTHIFIKSWPNYKYNVITGLVTATTLTKQKLETITLNKNKEISYIIKLVCSKIV